ncbi:hypothetical protein [Pelagibius marinus]|uniref:hypothetical protein n=1 Tax=Pelagibius marinus TaxID=2762760 RepID=UPI00187262EB|nr:hypothetical protein [Pelagibius marinus]
MSNSPVRKDLPNKHSAEIGRIVTRWSYLEWQLRQIAYSLLRISPKEGRLSVREPRVTDYLTMIEDLVQLKRLGVRVEWKKLRKHVDELADHRNRLAHGVWLKQQGYRVPCLQLTKGVWQPEPGKAPIKAKIDPVSVPITVDDLRSVVNAIDSVIEYIDKVRMAIDVRLNSLSNVG